MKTDRKRNNSHRNEQSTIGKRPNDFRRPDVPINRDRQPKIKNKLIENKDRTQKSKTRVDYARDRMPSPFIRLACLSRQIRK